MGQLLFFLVLIACGFFVGNLLEQRHYKAIKGRERQDFQRPCLASLKNPVGLNCSKAELVSGNVVIAVDYFKRLLFGFRNLFGGEIKSYASLVDRARREAIIRMKDSAPSADYFINVKVETSSISKGARGTITAVEMMAYGTAIWSNK